MCVFVCVCVCVCVRACAHTHATAGHYLSDEVVMVDGAVALRDTSVPYAAVASVSLPRMV